MSDGEISRFSEVLSKLNNYSTGIGLCIIAVFIFVLRLRNVNSFIVKGRPVLGGANSWYQLRSVKYSVRNWPNTIRFDPFASFPTGETVGLYGTLYDQIIATVAILVGFGSPTENTISMILLYSSPILAGVTVFPTYLLSEEIGSSSSGWISSVILVFLPGLFFYRSLIGVADFHAAIPVVLMTTMYITARSIGNLQNKSENITSLQKPPKFVREGVMSGVSMAVLLLIWPVGILFIGAFILFIVADVNRKHILGGTAGNLLQYSIIYAVTISIFMILSIDTMSFQISDFSLLHVLFPLTIVAYSSVILFINYQTIISNSRMYPISSFGVFIGLFVVSMFFEPRLLEAVSAGIKSTFGLWMVESLIGVQPLGNSIGSVVNNFYTYFGAMIFVSFISIFLLYWRSLTNGTSKTAYISIVGVVLIFSSITNIGFNFYLAPVVAVLSGVFINKIIKHIRFIQEFPNLSLHQYASVGVLLLLFIPVLLVPMGGTVFFAGSTHSPNGAQKWVGTVDWIEKETPQTGIDIYSDMPVTASESYSILTWRSSGTWVLSGGERPVVTSSIAPNSTLSSRLLLATSEKEFEQINSANVKYIAISSNDVSITGEFPEIVESHPTDTKSDYFFPVRNRNTGELAGTIKKQPYYESMGYRLFAANGARIRTQPVVANWDTERTQQGTVAVTPRNESVRQFDSFQKALLFIKQDGSAQIGGTAGIPPSSVSALENFRLVHASDNNVSSNSRIPEVKVFERVPGATITGTGPENETILAQVQLSTQDGYTFVYSQATQTDADGNFTMVVPYATTGYNEHTNGYVHTPIRAETPYRLRAIQETNNTTIRYQTTVNVSETRIVNKNTTPIQVKLTNTTEESQARGKEDG